MTNVAEVKGVGGKSLTLLNKLNINTIDELLMYYPYKYDLLARTDLKTVDNEEKVIVDGKIDCVPMVVRLKGNLNKMNFRLVTTDKKVVGVSIFNRAFLKKNLLVGSSVTIIGKYDKDRNIITAAEIRMGLLGNKDKIESVYHGTIGLTSKVISTYINTSLMKYGNSIVDFIPDYLVEKYKFLNKKTALNLIHNPSNKDNIITSSMRLKYEELFMFMTKINYLKMTNKDEKHGLVKEFDNNLIDSFIKKLPYELTKDQYHVLEEILEDLSSPHRMNRLLQGDVGSGKTIVALIGVYANYIAGYQSAFMAPTEILAKQHYNYVVNLFKDYNIRVSLLTGSTTKREKDKLYESLQNGDIDLIIGTHALIQEKVLYKNLGLVITDEQHRFGVLQRENLRNKGVYPDVLYMSATPIPRTYALTIYGDMDISTIAMLPKGRKPIQTYLKKQEEIKDVLRLVNSELQHQHQIYVIAPMIEDNDSELTNVIGLKEKMELAFGSKYNIDIIHGKLKQEVKDSIMEKFLDNEIQILISTTVIEVGVDVPNASMIVIFNADRFGLSTLHQLRGRVGRSDILSTCVLISDSDTKRLEVMTTTNDGFVISEEDFKLRGHGDLFGTKQSGDMHFRIANLKQDYKILVQAKKDAMEFLLLNDKKYDKLKSLIISNIKEG